MSEPKRRGVSILAAIMLVGFGAVLGACAVCAVGQVFMSGGGSASSPSVKPVARPTAQPVFELVTSSFRVDHYGRVEAVAEFANVSGRPVEGVRIWADCFDAAGTIIASEYMWADPKDLVDGQHTVRAVTLGEGVECDSVRMRATALH